MPTFKCKICNIQHHALRSSEWFDNLICPKCDKKELAKQLEDLMQNFEGVEAQKKELERKLAIEKKKPLCNLDSMEYHKCDFTNLERTDVHECEFRTKCGILGKEISSLQGKYNLMKKGMSQRQDVLIETIKRREKDNLDVEWLNTEVNNTVRFINAIDMGKIEESQPKMEYPGHCRCGAVDGHFEDTEDLDDFYYCTVCMNWYHWDGSWKVVEEDG